MDLDIQFPPLISYGASGGPAFLTNIAIMANRAESRNQELQFPDGKWTISHPPHFPEDYEPLLAFFHLAAGRANTFRFKDWTDYICAQGDGFFIDTNDSPACKQMVKRYTFGPFSYDVIISKPCDNGTIVFDGTGSLDYSNGQICGGTGNTAWYGEFDKPARFDTDELVAEVVSRNKERGLLIQWKSIPIVEVRFETEVESS